MRLNEIHVTELGVLQNITLGELPALSVIHGGNGTGKSTLADFVRHVLMGTKTPSLSRPHDTSTGSLRVSNTHHRWKLTSSRSTAGDEITHVQHLDNPNWSGGSGPKLPHWVTDEILHEIFFPGHVEADRFSRLVRLCLETGGASENAVEIRRAQQAIAQSVREREGTATEPGLNQQIMELERQRDALSHELRNLRQHDPGLAGRIRTVEEQITDLEDHRVRIETQCDRLRSQIADVQREIDNLDEQNSLSLNREDLRRRTTELAARRNRWSEIRSAIERESRDVQNPDVSGSRSQQSIRAVVGRLEQRMRDQDTERSDQWHRGVEQETAALCRFVAQQHDATQACEHHLESRLGADAASSIHHIEAMLQDQIAALQEELDRAENILEESLHRDMSDCDSPWHRSYRYRNGSAGVSVASLEAQLRALNEQLSSLIAESARNAEEIDRLFDRLADLRQQQQAAPALEEIDDLRARLAEVEARLELLISHRDVLLRTERSLGQVVTRLQKRQHSAALEIASPWLERLTGGECRRVFADVDNQDLLIETASSVQPLRIEQLSRGTQQQLALVLRLALLQARGETSDTLPFIIDDVFITSDDERGSMAADLLRDVASHGQQIIMLTCQNDVRALLAARGARVYSLSAITETIPVPVPEIPEPETSLVFKAFDGVAEECPGELEDTVVEDDDSHWLFYLEPEHSVSDLSGLAVSELKGLNAGDLQTIEQLLNCSVAEVKERIQEAGFFVTEDRLTELQTQARMAVCVPMLRQRDAELLVATGIDNVRQLARLRPEATFDLVMRFQQSDSGARFLRAGRTIDQQQAISWNRWALHARTVERALAAAAARESQPANSSGILTSSQRTSSGLRSRRERVRRSGQVQRRRVQSTTTDETLRRREARSERRRIQRRQSVEADNSVLQQSEQKFYLSRASEVEAAPSIGAVTAARLARVGVETVDDLLNCNAQTIATLLDNRRITTSVIEQWKAQSALVCTIPKLRGHDAQILVACGKIQAEEITDLSPEELFSVVQPFCDTTEGARIIRGGRKPDIKEVTDWISWARQSRPLKAA